MEGHCLKRSDHHVNVIYVDDVVLIDVRFDEVGSLDFIHYRIDHHDGVNIRQVAIQVDVECIRRGG